LRIAALGALQLGLKLPLGGPLGLFLAFLVAASGDSGCLSRRWPIRDSLVI
jgi:hypothetical protein